MITAYMITCVYWSGVHEAPVCSTKPYYTISDCDVMRANKLRTHNQVLEEIPMTAACMDTETAIKVYNAMRNRPNWYR